MLKLVTFSLLIAVMLCRTYPMFKQCDSRWGNNQLGTSSDTICSAGCLMSSAAMGLAGTGHGYNPATLNTWLTNNGGYIDGDGFVWASINRLGLTFEGRISNGQIMGKLDAGKVVMVNVHGGGHWVLAYGHSGDSLLVNDPGYSTTSYPLSQVIDGRTLVYGVAGSSYYNLMGKLRNIRSNDV
jgi:hypothetical protein